MDGTRADRAVGRDDFDILSKPHVRALIWDKSQGRCWYCGKSMHPFREFSIDHLVPQSRGGASNLANLVPCCRKCNMRKGNRDVEHFRRLCSVVFTREQLAHLRDHGICLPAMPAHRFWFEQELGAPRGGAD